MKKKTLSMLTVVVLVLLAFSTYAKADVLYVKPDGSDSYSGDSWDHALATIQGAIDKAIADDEIWVKEGTYALSSQINVDIAVAIYGGFDGTETSVSQRDWRNNVTTVDGQGSVRCFYLDADATIDGFTITGGNAVGLSFPDNAGGGMFIASSATIPNSTFSHNSAGRWGGGILIDSPSYGPPYPPISPPESTNFSAIMERKEIKKWVL